MIGQNWKVLSETLPTKWTSDCAIKPISRPTSEHPANTFSPLCFTLFRNIAAINAVSRAAHKAAACLNHPQIHWTNTVQTGAGEINSSLANYWICVQYTLQWHSTLILRWLADCCAELLLITWPEYPWVLWIFIGQFWLCVYYTLALGSLQGLLSIIKLSNRSSTWVCGESHRVFWKLLHVQYFGFHIQNHVLRCIVVKTFEY